YRRPGRRRRARVDQVGNGLSLRNVDLTVQKRTLAELARPRHAASEPKGALHQQIHDQRATVSVQLENVLPGERRRRGEVQGETLIQRVALAVQETREPREPRRRQVSEDRACDARHVRPGHPNDSDRPSPGGTGDGDDGVRGAHRPSLRDAAHRYTTPRTGTPKAWPLPGQRAARVRSAACSALLEPPG